MALAAVRAAVSAALALGALRRAVCTRLSSRWMSTSSSLSSSRFTCRERNEKGPLECCRQRARHSVRAQFRAAGACVWFQGDTAGVE